MKARVRQVFVRPQHSIGRIVLLYETGGLLQHQLPGLGQRKPVILAVERGGRIEPMRQDFAPKPGDGATIALLEERAEEALSALAAIGWKPHEVEAPEGAEGPDPTPATAR